MDPQTLALAAAMFVGAALYSSVGHAGASAYIALMALFGVETGVMRPTALVLNIIVASIAASRYVAAGMFRWRVLWPFLIASTPMAFLGGSIQLPGVYYRPVVGVVLLLGALRLLLPRGAASAAPSRDPPVWGGLLSGVAIGLLSGLTGTGGGIFLSPLLLFFNWAGPKAASGVAAVFILLNSIAGLSGNIASVKAVPADLPIYAVAVVLGAGVGTTLGIRFSNPAVMRALGLVLAVAGLKLLRVY